MKQLNLLLSKETEVYDDVHLIDTSLTDLESSVAGKLLQYVHRTQMRELSHLQKAQHYEIKDYLQMSYATSRVWIYWKMLERARNTVLFSGSWMKPRQLWECVSYVLGLIVL